MRSRRPQGHEPVVDLPPTHLESQAVHRRDVALLFLVVAATRIWFLDSGFGSDADSWQMADSGYWLVHAGEYILSRRPGYPLDEFVMAALQYLEGLVRGPGWIVPNGFSSLVFALQCAFFYRLARRVGAPGALALVAAYALHPVAFDQSVGSLDFHLPILLMLWGVDRAFTRRWIHAAILFGFALAARVTFAPMVIAFVVWFGDANRSWRRALGFAAIAAAIATPFYVPILLRYRGTIPPIPLDVHPVKAWIRLGVFETVGVGATLALAAAALTGLGSLWAGVVRRRDPHDRFLVLALLIHLVVFLVKPYDGAYLLPAMPFLFILLGRHARSQLVAAFLVLLILNGLVSVPGLGRDDAGRSTLEPWSAGEMFDRLATRRMNRRVHERIARQAVAPGTVLVLGGHMPALWFHERVHLVARRRFEIVGGGIPRFNKPLYEPGRDVYYIASWEVARAVELAGRGYVVRALEGLPPSEMAAMRAALAGR